MGEAIDDTILELATIEAIVAIEDPVARNHAITRGYHALSEAVAGILGRDQAHWLTFGQWASAEAGRSIRGESVPGLLRPLVADGIATAVAAGNAAVFADVAPPFIRFVRVVRDRPEAAQDPAVAANVHRELVADPRLAASEDLRRAFRAYLDALLDRDAADASARHRRAQRAFVANVSIGAHEQVVADPHVRAAVPGRSIIAIAATAHLGIRVPDGVLELERDIPPPAYLGGAAFPADLRDLDDPDALALAERFGQDPGSTRHSDAPDWESYHERMGFIFSFLRTYQQDPDLFELPPGTPIA